MTGEDLKSLPLEDLHKAAGARFGGFAGWSMPLTYPPGVMKEHLHTREHVGLKPEGRQPVRSGTALTDADGKPAGRVTSGGFGPSTGFPVAMSYVSAALAKPGTRVFADVRGTKVPVDVHPLPFTPHRYRKG